MGYVDPATYGTPASGGLIKSTWGIAVQQDIEYFRTNAVPRAGGNVSVTAEPLPVYNVADYATGGVGVGTDITAAVQAAVNALRSPSVPAGILAMAPGTISTSIDCTNIVSNTQGVSIHVEGAGKGATRISGLLGAAFPVFDFSGSGRAALRNLYITGSPSGSQTCAVRFARASNGFGDNTLLENVIIDGTYSQVCVAAMNDQWRLNGVELAWGGSGISLAWTTTDEFSVGSAYTTLGTPSNTLGTLANSDMQSNSRSCLYNHNGGALYLEGYNYCNLTGTATAAIEINGGGSQSVRGNLRMEANGSTVATSLLMIDANSRMVGGVLGGDWVINNSGTVVGFANNTNCSISSTIFKPSSITHQGTGAASWFADNHGVFDCEIHNGGLANLTSFGASSGNPDSNRIYQGSNAFWTNIPGVATGGNIQFGNAGISTLNDGHRFTQGSGAPTTPGFVNPQAGDIYFRTDTPSTANQRIYICTTGGASPVWSGIV